MLSWNFSHSDTFLHKLSGIKNKKHTLSERGHPCHYNPVDRSCGWCGLFSQQCNGWDLYNGLKCGEVSPYAPGKEGWGKYCIGQGNENLSKIRLR